MNRSIERYKACAIGTTLTSQRSSVGERFAYSNLGIDLAGDILQKVTGTPFATCLERMIFDPLGMSDSTCDSAVYASRKNRAVGQPVGDEHDKAPLEIPIIPSGGVYSSARDMATYAMFHLNGGRAGGKQLLERRLWEEMQSRSYAGDLYGLGVVRERYKFGDTVLDKFNHNGGGFGFGCVFSFYPAAGLAWAASFNRPEPAGYEAFNEDLCNETLERAYGKKQPVLSTTELKTVDVPREAQEQFVGNWVGRGGEMYEIKLADGMLGMNVHGTFHELSFTSPVDAFLIHPFWEVAPLHLQPANELRPKFLRCPHGPSFADLDYNDGAADAPGPNKKEWQRYVGDYHTPSWGKRGATIKIHIKNGYLYLDQRKLIVEHEPGLFFASDGEALDFRREQATWFSVPLQRVR